MGASLLAALAAMGAMAVAPDGTGERAAGFAQEAAPRAEVARVLLAIASTAAAVAVANDGEEAIEITPLRFSPFSRRRDGSLDSQIELGVGLALAAYRQKDRDPFERDAFRSEARTMGKFIPGYPQPAKIVVGVKVAF